MYCYLVGDRHGDRTCCGVENNLLLNGDFSLGLDENSLPLRGQALRYDGRSERSLSNEYKTAGEHPLAVVDANAEKSVGMRSMRVNAAAGQRFLAEVDVRIQSGDAMVYLDFHNDKGQRVDAKILTIRGPIEWQTVSVEGIAPEGTVDVSIILYSGLVNRGRHTSITFACIYTVAYGLAILFSNRGMTGNDFLSVSSRMQ